MLSYRVLFMRWEYSMLTIASSLFELHHEKTRSFAYAKKKKKKAQINCSVVQHL